MDRADHESRGLKRANGRFAARHQPIDANLRHLRPMGDKPCARNLRRDRAHTGQGFDQGDEIGRRGQVCRRGAGFLLHQKGGACQQQGGVFWLCLDRYMGNVAHGA